MLNTQSAVANVIKRILHQLNNGSNVATVLIDISRAFLVHNS